MIGKGNVPGGDCLAYREKERAATLGGIALRILASFPFSCSLCSFVSIKNEISFHAIKEKARRLKRAFPCLFAALFNSCRLLLWKQVLASLLCLPLDRLLMLGLCNMLRYIQGLSSLSAGLVLCLVLGSVALMGLACGVCAFSFV